LRDRPGIYARVSAFLDWIQKNKWLCYLYDDDDDDIFILL
jgi:hypothetical protein